jgi:hypothetical protein
VAGFVREAIKNGQTILCYTNAKYNLPRLGEGQELILPTRNAVVGAVFFGLSGISSQWKVNSSSVAQKIRHMYKLPQILREIRFNFPSIFRGVLSDRRTGLEVGPKIPVETQPETAPTVQFSL